MLCLGVNSPKTANRQNIVELILTNAQAPKPKPPPRASLPKSDLRYWKARVKLPVYTKDGQSFRAPHYAIQLSRNGQRRNLSLETGDKEEAAKKAMRLWQDIANSGWDTALANLRPVASLPSDTVGDLISAVEKGVQRSPTRESYIRAFRQLVAEVMGIKRQANTVARIKGWKERVGKVRLADLTPEKIERWRLRRVEAAGDHLAQHSTKVTLNTLCRFSKALFSPKVMKQIGLSVANPFKDIGYLKAQPKKYQPTFDVRTLFKNAEAELGLEEKKVFLLGVCCGLRRREIDYLEWPSFDWQKNAIVIRETKWFGAKTDDSHGVVPVDPELMKRFYGFYVEHEKVMEAKKPERRNDFVIQSVFAKPRLNKNYIRYRCDFSFQKLTAWLRANGVTGPRPLHTLRKEAGSLINAEQGIHAAQRFLRHSDIKITAAIYADNRGMKPISLSALTGP